MFTNQKSFITDTHWQGLELAKLDTYEVSSLNKINYVMQQATSDCSRVFVLRVDLRLPRINAYHEPYHYNPDVISMFKASLQAQLNYHNTLRVKENKQVYSNKVRFVWARERGESDLPHYHVAILVNNEIFNRTGCYPDGYLHPLCLGTPKSLSEMIICAWASALNQDPYAIEFLIHFCDQGEYRLRRNQPDFGDAYKRVFKRLSYLAKIETRYTEDSRRSFGCSLN